MDTASWQRAGVLFTQWLELSPPQRGAQLAALARDEPLLHEALLRLVRAHESEEDVLGGLEDAVAAAFQPDEELAAGTRVGPFEIQRPLGQGGMGRVYLAVREHDGVRQSVALKLPVARALDREFRERLRAERRALAGLEHRGIARLVEAGELPDGRPYFAMEYVDGEPLDRACDRRNLAIEQRVALFLEVCAAVQHAHASLLVHRDLKAANVLVTQAGEVKLLDFGIAKPLRLNEDAGTPTADPRQFFSPSAAAPEQVKGEVSSVATDVYALGLLLYELLAGCSAYAVGDAAPAQVLARIVEEIPPRASVRVRERAAGEPQAAASAAQRRGLATTAEHAARLTGDLDAILARCLRKAPRERYVSVHALADDLRALLALRPIAIRSGERGYRLRRFARRHRLPLALAATLALLALAFIATILVQSARLARERDLARESQQRAEFQRNRAERVVEFLVGLFRASDPYQARGEDVRASVLLQRAGERLKEGLRDDAAIRASLLATLADIHMALSRYDDAAQFADQAARLREPLRGEDEALAQSRVQQARLALARGNAEPVTALVAQARRLRDQAGASVPDEAELLGLESAALAAGGKVAEALAAAREALALRVHQHGALDERTIDAARRLVTALNQAGYPEEARALRRNSLDQRLAALTDPDDPRRVLVLRERARLHVDDDELDAAHALLQEALALSVRSFGAQHVETALTLGQVGLVACRRGELKAGLEALDRSLAIRRALFGESHPLLATAEFNIGSELLHQARDATDALPFLERAVAVGSRAYEDGHPNLNIFRIELGSALRDLGRLDAAEQTLVLARRHFETINAPRGLRLARIRGELACIALTRGGERRRIQQELDAALVQLDRFAEETEVERRRLRVCARAAARG